MRRCCKTKYKQREFFRHGRVPCLFFMQSTDSCLSFGQLFCNVCFSVSAAELTRVQRSFGGVSYITKRGGMTVKLRSVLPVKIIKHRKPDITDVDYCEIERDQ